MAVLWWPNAREFVVGSILEAICHGHELLRVWPADALWYNKEQSKVSGPFTEITRTCNVS